MKDGNRDLSPVERANGESSVIVACAPSSSESTSSPDFPFSAGLSIGDGFNGVLSLGRDLPTLGEPTGDVYDGR